MPQFEGFCGPGIEGIGFQRLKSPRVFFFGKFLLGKSNGGFSEGGVFK